MDLRNILGKLDQINEGTMSSAKKKPTGPKFVGKMKGTDPASAAKDKYVGSSMEESIFKELEETLQKQPARDLKREFAEFKLNESSSIERKIHRTQALIQDYYNRARETRNDIRRDHFINMARQLESDLDSMINDANQAEQDSYSVAQHDAEPSATWNRGGLEEGSEIAKPGQLVQIIKAPRMLDLLPGETFEVRSSNEQGVTLKHGMGTKFDNVIFPHGTYKIVRAQGLKEFAPGGRDDDGDGRSKLVGSIAQLLKAGKKVDFYVPGIRGHVSGIGGQGEWVTLKRWNKPYSKINYSLALDSSDDNRFALKMIKPDYYQVVEKQGMAEGSSGDAFAAGYSAFRSNTTKNPYKPGSEESRQWDLGWETAQSRTWDKEGVAEGLKQTLRKVVPGYAKREIDKKMDAGKFGKTDADKDANFQRYKKIQDKIKEGDKKPHPETWHDVDPKLGKQVDKMSQAEKVKKGLAHPDTLKKPGVAEGIDSEELANEVYAEFERMYPNLARRADERTVHAAIMDVLNYGGDNDPSALAQDVARAVKRDIEQGVAESFSDLELAVMEGGHELVKENPVPPTAPGTQPVAPGGKPTLGADLSKSTSQQQAQQNQAKQQADAAKQAQLQQQQMQKGVNNLKSAGAAISNAGQTVQAFNKVGANTALTPSDKNNIASAGTVLAPIMANQQLAGKFKDLVSQASAAEKQQQQKQQQQQAQQSQPVQPIAPTGATK